MVPLTERDSLDLIAISLGWEDAIPKDASLPLLLYRQVLVSNGVSPDRLATEFEALFEYNDWPEPWRNGILPFHHHHSRAHEVLGVYRGSCSILFGGADGEAIEMRPGDMAIVPAGMGHKKVSSKGRLGVVGSYPKGQLPDLCHGERNVESVDTVALPAQDPAYGKGGPMFDHWT